MNPLTALRRPEYFFRPTQILRSLRFHLAPHTFADRLVDLPWGLSVKVQTGDLLGRAICTVGLDDLPVCETILRLLDPGDLAVDVGANLGQMTGLMACAVRPGGRVLALEPHPVMFAELAANIRRWAAVHELVPVTAVPYAASAAAGPARLQVPTNFAANRGTARLDPAAAEGLPCRSLRLADLLADEPMIALIKIDVEGHEEAVLTGARPLLEERRIRDLVFECHGPLPPSLTGLLAGCGYHLLALGRSFLRPVLLPADRPAQFGHAPSYLASLAPDRARSRLRWPGWRALRPQTGALGQPGRRRSSRGATSPATAGG